MDSQPKPELPVKKGESLWSAPDNVLDRLNLKGQNTEWRDFLLCGLYCTVAVFFLVFYGFAAVLRGEIPYATVIFGFAVMTCVVYGVIWLSGQYHVARHFLVALMASLCLFLYYSGGTENTGPLYYFIFPIVALFLQGIRLGSVSIVLLLLLTLLMQETGIFGFDRERYSFVFMSRIDTVYIIVSILALLFAWFRENAERQLLMSQEDLERITHADLLTGLANREFLEKLLELEFQRKRYGSTFCLAAMKVDNFERIHRRYGTDYSNTILKQAAEMLMQTLRRVDTPARWEENVILIILPESSLPGAQLMAARIKENIKKDFARSALGVTVSFGICEAEEDAAKSIATVTGNLALADPDAIVVGKQPVPPRTPTKGLSASFDKSKH